MFDLVIKILNVNMLRILFLYKQDINLYKRERERERIVIPWSKWIIKKYQIIRSTVNYNHDQIRMQIRNPKES